MKRRDTATEVKVGLLILVGIAVLLYMTFRISKLERIEGNTYYALFPTVSGLAKGAPVEVAGVVVGRVEEIGLEGKKARVTMVISKKVKLFEDATATLRTHGALGDKFIEVDPGTPSLEPLKPKGLIPFSKVTPDLDQLFLSLQKTAEGLAGMGEALDDLMGDKETRQAFKELVLNLRDSSREFKLFLATNRERLDRTIANLEAFSKDLDPLLNKASQGLDRMQSALASFEELGRNLKEGRGTLGRLLTDKSLYEDLREAANGFRLLARRVNRGEGTLGKLLTDEELYRDLKETVEEFKALARRVNRGEGTLGKLLTDEGLYLQAERTLKKVERAAEGIQEQTPITVLGTAAGMIF